MKINFNQFFNNNIVLYILSFITLTNILAYFIQQKYVSIFFFMLVGFLTSYFSKNMTIILLISIISTNFLAAFSNIFKIKIVAGNKKEGFENDKCNQDNENKCNDISGCNWSNNKCQLKSLATDSNIESDNNTQKSEISNKFENMKKSEDGSNILENILNTGDVKKIIDQSNVSELAKKTNLIMNEQNNLITQMKDVTPVLKEAISAMSSLGNGNYMELFDSLSGKVENLYEKYPSSFPKNYKEQYTDLKDKLKKVEGLKNDLKNYTSVNNTNI